ncbi:siderophore ABC transporter substrate-binding protein [Corynebacterium cystitidis]|uniref:siderophore ABC transporter substrate-binding protein n=1 Tax=Corynebacterium cystitidis TaxID=35757 RepID=UPI00211F0E88|nr:ABC transporter substrate-binding protein [Corynebacterium cystitidis]
MSLRLSSRKAIVAAISSFALVLTGCSQTDDSAASSSSASSAESSTVAADSQDTITIEDNYGTVEVPANPEAIAALDNRTFEVLEQWGVELVAAPLKLVPETIGYKSDESIVDIGNHKEPDLEALAATQPDLIINGQRFGKYYEDLKKLNPEAAIIDLEPRDGEAMDEELIRQVETLGKAMGKEDEAAQLVDDFNDALGRAKAAYDPEKSVMAVNVSGGNIGYVAPSVGRFWGPIFDMVGMTPALEVPEGSDNHKGDDISVEAIAEANPDWLLVLDRDAAIGGDSAPAETVIEGSSALQNVTALKEGAVVYAPADTYTNESIITYTETLNALADAFEAQK